MIVIMILSLLSFEFCFLQRFFHRWLDFTQVSSFKFLTRKETSITSITSLSLTSTQLSGTLFRNNFRDIVLAQTFVPFAIIFWLIFYFR